MKRSTIYLLLSTILCSASAQGFKESLEATVEGQGTVHLIQDPRIDDILEGNWQRELPQQQQSLADKHTGYAQGYRIQIFWGGATRADQQRAQQMANRARSLCPDFNAYVEFVSPHWRTRVGDFRTLDDAQEHLSTLRRLDSSAMVVRSKIDLSQTEEAKRAAEEAAD